MITLTIVIEETIAEISNKTQVKVKTTEIDKMETITETIITIMKLEK